MCNFSEYILSEYIFHFIVYFSFSCELYKYHFTTNFYNNFLTDDVKRNKFHPLENGTWNVFAAFIYC